MVGTISGKKALADRFASVLIALLFSVFFISNILGFTVNAAEQAPYDKDYSIINILSDYQYFVQGDLTVGNHNVGAMASGGNASFSHFGDGAIVPSYFENIVAAGNYNGSATSHFLKDDEAYAGYIGLPAYYKTASPSASVSNLTQYTSSVPFIDFDTAFASLSAESTALTNGAYIVSQADITGDQYNGYTLNLTFSGNNSVVIPADIYSQINYIRLSGISSMNDLIGNAYTISIIGVTDISMTFGYIGYSTSNETGTKGILFSDGQSFNNNNSLKNMSGAIKGGQMNMDGMKLIWNFPSATSISTDYTAGHVVAPNATVTISNNAGNFEGGIISKELINATGEGHFFPYMGVGESRVTTPVEVEIDAIKVIVTDGEDPVVGAVIGIYSDPDCLEQLSNRTSSIDYNGESDTYESSVVEFQDDVDGLELEPSNTYYIKQVSVPEGYNLSETVIECIIDDEGNVTYRVLGSSDTPSTEYPQFMSEKTTIDIDDPGIPGDDGDDPDDDDNDPDDNSGTGTTTSSSVTTAPTGANSGSDPEPTNTGSSTTAPTGANSGSDPEPTNTGSVTTAPTGANSGSDPELTSTGSTTTAPTGANSGSDPESTTTGSTTTAPTGANSGSDPEPTSTGSSTSAPTGANSGSDPEMTNTGSTTAVASATDSGTGGAGSTASNAGAAATFAPTVNNSTGAESSSASTDQVSIEIGIPLNDDDSIKIDIPLVDSPVSGSKFPYASLLLIGLSSVVIYRKLKK